MNPCCYACYGDDDAADDDYDITIWQQIKQSDLEGMRAVTAQLVKRQTQLANERAARFKAETALEEARRQCLNLTQQHAVLQAEHARCTAIQIQNAAMRTRQVR